MDKIFLEMSFYWLSDDIVRSRSKWGFRRNVQKCNRYVMQNRFCSDDVIITDDLRRCCHLAIADKARLWVRHD